MEAMAARVKAHPEKMKLRKQLCEHPFGTIKRFFGYTYFLMKGLVKVRCEWSLMTLAYNLKRVLEPGELRETDGGGGGENPAKGLKRAASPVFIRRSWHHPRLPSGRTQSREIKNRHSELSNHRPIFFPSPPNSFYTNSRDSQEEPVFASNQFADFFLNLLRAPVQQDD